MNIEIIKDKVKELLKDEATGHDYLHAERVYKNAKAIAEGTSVNLSLIEASCYLHDVDDDKIFETIDYANAKAILSEAEASEAEETAIIEIISEISFSKGLVPNSLEGKIVQDADRLDAIGAIGIARAFAYGGAKHRKLYDPEISPRDDMTIEEYRSSNGTTLNHFYEKLLKLENLMNTEKGREIAHERTMFMKEYLVELENEIEGINILL